MRPVNTFFKTVAHAGPVWLLGVFLTVVAFDPAAQESVRAQEIAQCRPGEISTWGDGRDRPAHSKPLVFVYEHAGAPAWFDAALVLGAVQKAAVAWSACGVPALVLSAAATPPDASAAVRVHWSDQGASGNFGLANLGQRTLALGPGAFALLKKVNPAYDASQTLQMVISHEMGHHFGLMAHSRRCVDVTSYYDNGKGEKCLARDPAQLRSVPEYRWVLPTACDIARCRIANGLNAQPVEMP